MVKNCRTPATRRSNRTILADLWNDAKSDARSAGRDFSGRPRKSGFGVPSESRQAQETHAKYDGAGPENAGMGPRALRG